MDWNLSEVGFLYVWLGFGFVFKLVLYCRKGVFNPIYFSLKFTYLMATELAIFP